MCIVCIQLKPTTTLFTETLILIYKLPEMRVTPLLVRSIQVGEGSGRRYTVRSTQRIGAQYAKNLLNRTQTSIVTLKFQFLSRNTTNVTDKVN